MSFKYWLRIGFVFIVLNMNILCFSERQSNCSCVRFHWKAFHFSFLPEGKQYWKKAVCDITNYCLQKTNSSLLKNNASCKWTINVTFPLISEDPWPNITFKKLPRPVLAMKEISSSTGVLNALVQIWKLFAFCLLAAALSGIIIWFFDHKANSGHFPKSFWSGVREGMWWAIVTMTTTGYGDRTPKSLPARVYASLWMIIGLVLMSLITAHVSSTITADSMRPLNDVFGNKVGVPKGSKKFFEKHSYGAQLVTEYSTQKELLGSLKNGSEDQIWLFDCEKEAKYMVVDVFNEAPNIGVQIRIPETRDLRYFTGNLTQLIDRMTMNDDDDDDGGDDNNDRFGVPDKDTIPASYNDKEDGIVVIPEILKPLAQKIRGNNDSRYRFPDKRCFKLHNRGKYLQSVKRTTGPERMEFVDYLLCGFVGLLLVLLIIGTLWETCLRARNGENITASNVDVEKGAAPSGHEMKTMNEFPSIETIVN